MAKNSNGTVETAEQTHEHNAVFKAARTVLLAAVGTVALGKEEIEAIVNRLVERGEIAEQDGKELVTDLLERHKKDVTKAPDKVEGVLDQRVDSILNRMNVPSKSDVESLSRKIGALSQKVDELNKKVSS
ncbi:MAG: poly(hydroxyalkanoate) granule-associated protein [Chloroflexi bacterium]|nr:poly(hydroxyalkanoate) granule-associated protein [Chloroflexota bacterium]